MTQQKFKYLYGPVHSWRLGMSLGIDPIATEEKICNFNCVYCQLGDTAVQTRERKIFVATQALVDEVNAFIPPVPLDYLTFSGRGEPTLAKNLGEMLRALKAVRRERIAVITNSGLMGDPQVCEDLMAADCVLAKLDAPNQHVFDTIDRPSGENFFSIVDGLKEFARVFKGKFALQLMFIPENKDCGPAMAEIAREIAPQEIELNTPLRPCAVQPLGVDEMQKIQAAFQGIPGVTMVYDRKRQSVDPMDEEATIRRHGDYKH
ncbi:MAG TPA: radical SAM protein [Candidatus Bathyarchaeia archaeon]|nr:radical SAM protein [Candidatus Bathyarchaeia archaeon]